tara:strand:- start:445 stop:819 length:375 start_codon:yes stop_codon:yes gene_type:complete
MATNNSYKAFLETLDNPEISTKRKELLELFQVREFTTYYDCERLLPHFRPGTLSARFSELLDFGMVKEVRNGIFTYVEDEEERVRLENKRDDEKFDKWEKKGYKEGWIVKIQMELINRLDKNII